MHSQPNINALIQQTIAVTHHKIVHQQLGKLELSLYQLNDQNQKNSKYDWKTFLVHHTTSNPSHNYQLSIPLII